MPAISLGTVKPKSEGDPLSLVGLAKLLGIYWEVVMV